MEINTLSDPARFAQAIRALARDAHRTLTHSPSAAALRGSPDASTSSRPPSGTAAGARSGPGWTTSGERCGLPPSTGPGRPSHVHLCVVNYNNAVERPTVLDRA